MLRSALLSLMAIGLSAALVDALLFRVGQRYKPDAKSISGNIWICKQWIDLVIEHEDPVSACHICCIQAEDSNIGSKVKNWLFFSLQDDTCRCRRSGSTYVDAHEAGLSRGPPRSLITGNEEDDDDEAAELEEKELKKYNGARECRNWMVEAALTKNPKGACHNCCQELDNSALWSFLRFQNDRCFCQSVGKAVPAPIDLPKVSKNGPVLYCNNWLVDYLETRDAKGACGKCCDSINRPMVANNKPGECCCNNNNN